MDRPVKSREQRVAKLLKGMPHVPPSVKIRFEEAFLQADPSPRGMPKALEVFYAHLAAAGRLPEHVTTEDFELLSASRTGHRTLLAALRKFAPGVPLAAARLISQRWDHWLNNRYNQKPLKPITYSRVSLAVEEWPDVWQSVVPRLDQVTRINGRRFPALAPKTRENVLHAVGMLATARKWARACGISLGETFSSDLLEVFYRYMLIQRKVSTRTVADYLERAQIFGNRGDLLDDHANETLSELVGTLREDASEQEPSKRAKLRRFREQFTLTDILKRALMLSVEAVAAPDGTAEAERKRRTALILALLINSGDRQVDLFRLTIGEHLRRSEEGLWSFPFHQAKTARWKDLGPLWPLTNALIDGHILAGRPHSQIEDRIHALKGCNLLSLSDLPFRTYFATSVLRQEFGVSGHLIRTLITDLLRNERPDAAWAAKEMLGHSRQRMQNTYQSDFRATASVRQWHELLNAADAQYR